MKTVSMTEFNQNPSRIARLAERDEVIVLRRGRAVLKVTGVDASAGEDPLDAMIRAGLARPPRARKRRTDPFPSVRTNADLGTMLDADRNRLDD